MGFRVGNLGIESRALVAPMAGITDAPFRRAVRRFAPTPTYTEMAGSRELALGDPRAAARAGLDPAELSGAALAGVQIAGREPAAVAEAARMAEAAGARLIDLNMGCPAKKVTGGLSGAALMRDEDLAASLVEAAADAASVPVTVKMRLGWGPEDRTAPALARRVVAAGARAVTVHGRTRAQFYSGEADWRAVGAVVEAVDVPVIVNGDVTDAAAARAALAGSGAAAVMVGRAMQGRPWTAAAIDAALAGRPGPAIPEGRALAEAVAEHYEDMLSHHGAGIGLRRARKHLGWWLRGRGLDALLASLMREEDPAAVLGALRGPLAARLADAAPARELAA